MKYQEFLHIMEQNQEKELVFDFENGAIRKDYHITEVLNTKVNSIDCGGALDVWSETILQLVEPNREENERYMETSKALNIIKKSDAKILLDANSEMLLEYRPDTVSAAQRYHVSEILQVGVYLRVKAVGTKTQCKAAERNNTECTTGSKEKVASSCCAPSKNFSSTKMATVCCG